MRKTTKNDTKSKALNAVKEPKKKTKAYFKAVDRELSKVEKLTISKEDTRKEREKGDIDKRYNELFTKLENNLKQRKKQAKKNPDDYYSERYTVSQFLGDSYDFNELMKLAMAKHGL